MSDIRVLFFDHTAALGGGEIALANLVSHLNPENIKSLVVLGAEGPLAEQLRPIVETQVLPLSPSVRTQKKDKLGFGTLLRVRDGLRVAKYVNQLTRLIRERNISVVHTNSLKADIIGGIAARLAPCPVVWHVRDRIEDDYLPKSVVRLFRFLCQVIPTYVIANSAATLSTLHLGNVVRGTAIPSGIEFGGRSVVVHDGTSESLSGEKISSENEFRIGLVGRISPWKGQDIFIKAAALVHQRFPNARFLIIGAALFDEDEYEQEVRKLPAELGIAGVVEFTGFRSDIKKAVGELDMLVHASTKGEPFGQVIIEGMAAGKPVVATDGGGVPEIVENGRTGILVPMGDVEAMAEAMCRIISDPAASKEMGVRGRQRVSDHFTLDQTARRVEAVYAEILQ